MVLQLLAGLGPLLPADLLVTIPVKYLRYPLVISANLCYNVSILAQSRLSQPNQPIERIGATLAPGVCPQYLPAQLAGLRFAPY
jgi:hypothetical protein